jgi:hypothetical protein
MSPARWPAREACPPRGPRRQQKATTTGRGTHRRRQKTQGAPVRARDEARAHAWLGLAWPWSPTPFPAHVSVVSATSTLCSCPGCPPCLVAVHRRDPPAGPRQTTALYHRIDQRARRGRARAFSVAAGAVTGSAARDAGSSTRRV